MDPALLKERELFKRRAIANPTIESKKIKRKVQHEPSSESQPKRHKPQSTRANSRPAGSKNFKCLAKIVDFLKARFKDGDTYPIAINEILDETQQQDITFNLRQWLITEALVDNPKIRVTPDGKYVFQPPYDVRNKKGLLRLLDDHDQRGLGGILQEDVEESFRNADKAIKTLNEKVVVIIRPADKKKVLFFNDESVQFEVDEEFQKLWKGVSMEGLDEDKIEEYLGKHGISSMKGDRVREKIPLQKRKRVATRRKPCTLKHNEHLGDILQDYSHLN